MKSVSIDIDGVIAQHLIPHKHNRFLHFLNQKYQLKRRYSRLEMLLHTLISNPKRPIPEAIRAMQKLQEQSYTIILNSGRPSFLEEATYKWLKRHGIAGYVHGLRLRHAGKEVVDAKLSTIKEGHIDIHFDDDPSIVEELLGDDSIQTIFFINTDEEARTRFQHSEKVICASTLDEAVQYLLEDKHE